MTFAFSKRSDPVSNRQHVSGKDNVVADALSRGVMGVQDSISAQSLFEAQVKDPETPMVGSSLTSLSFQTVEFAPGITFLCDVSLFKPRPWVPNSLRRVIFDAVHNTAHPGAEQRNASCLSSTFDMD